MPALFSRYATPFVTGLFLVSLLSGIALFFHWGPGALHPMHEWLSMVLIVPFVLHLQRNWRAFANYFKRPPMAIALALSLIAALAFFVPGASGKGRVAPPQFALAHRILGATVAEIAPALALSPEALSARLSAAGIAPSDPSASLLDLAAPAGKTEADLARALIGAPSGT
ncbi:DUF4405 domain-containing protein [Paenirhodobacter enshiensis]|uniref:DUF4405 domain-containing protein n=1 Tax=Paenirhodobacter enshiensis TaxID=1105367 RepID=UPI003FA239FE